MASHENRAIEGDGVKVYFPNHPLVEGAGDKGDDGDDLQGKQHPTAFCHHIHTNEVRDGAK